MPSRRRYMPFVCQSFERKEKKKKIIGEKISSTQQPKFISLEVAKESVVKRLFVARRDVLSQV